MLVRWWQLMQERMGSNPGILSWFLSTGLIGKCSENIGSCTSTANICLDYSANQTLLFDQPQVYHKGAVLFVKGRFVKNWLWDTFCDFVKHEKVPTRDLSTKYIFNRARSKRRWRFNNANVVLMTFHAMTPVLEERMSEGLRAEQAPSNPRPRGRRRCSVQNILVNKLRAGTFSFLTKARVDKSPFDKLLPTLS